MRRGFRSGILLAFGLTLSLFISEKSFCKQVVVAVTQLVAHPAVDAVREGIKESLKAEGYIEGDNMRFVFANAHGNIATANQIAQKFAGMSPDVIVAITTPSAQSFMSFIKNSNIPLIFAGVTNPISGRLVKDMNHPGGNVTGTSDKPKIPEQIGLIRKILRKDGLITVGVVYNSGEANSVEQVQAAKIEATRNN
ncbi:MAG: ABC transporter substrate-binding protein, partial [Alphaproteobacteria bacterium]